jgi:hypothetical protein
MTTTPATTPTTTAAATAPPARPPGLPAPAGPRTPSPLRELWANRWLQGFLVVWAAAVAYIALADRSVLPLSDQEPWAYFSGVLGAAASLAVLFRLARGTAPVDSRNGPAFRDPARETAGLLVWMALVLAVGSLLDIRTHIAFVGLAEGPQEMWAGETARSTLVWAAYNFVGLAVLPYLFFRYRLGYTPASMLLRFPRPRIWLPYFLVIGTLGFVFAITPEYTSTPLSAHLLTLVLFTVGSFLPIMITTQSLLTPRLAHLTGSWVTGAVLSAIAYAALNVTEAFLAWGTGAQVLLSLAWFMQVAFWGLVKAITTLRTGNAWLHIATTHTIHLVEAPAVATTFSIR